MSNVTVIDAKRGLRPRASASDAEVAARLKELQEKAAGRDATGILRLALLEEFPGKTAVVSSFGAESVVLLKLVADIDSSTPILFLNTGKLFGETLRYRDRLQDVLGLGDVRSLAPSQQAREENDPDGTLWSRNTDACCHFRKTVPLAKALEPFQAQITGRKRFQTRARGDMQPVEFFEGRFRFNPLWQWDLHQLEAFVERNNLPRHPLVEDGYPSIGCMPCTRRVQAGEDYRAGRWSGLDKDECGIHLTDGGGI
ncbi:MAG TPA: phosphoadenylyl-sulfate reductase [Rhizomicrobium sp.]|nr:phosphoadenylyl-sulfate reductase [Rhizomicrobium sp.]